MSSHTLYELDQGRVVTKIQLEHTLFTEAAKQQVQNHNINTAPQLSYEVRQRYPPSSRTFPLQFLFNNNKNSYFVLKDDYSYLNNQNHFPDDDTNINVFNYNGADAPITIDAGVSPQQQLQPQQQQPSPIRPQSPPQQQFVQVQMRPQRPPQVQQPQLPQRPQPQLPQRPQPQPPQILPPITTRPSMTPMNTQPPSQQPQTSPPQTEMVSTSPFWRYVEFFIYFTDHLRLRKLPFVNKNN